MTDDAKRNTEDADKLLALAMELRAEIAKSSTQVVSVKASKGAGGSGRTPALPYPPSRPA